MRRFRIAIIIIPLLGCLSIAACATEPNLISQDRPAARVNPANNNFEGYHVGFPITLKWTYTDKGRLVFKHFILPARTREIYAVGFDKSAVYVAGNRNRISKLDIHTGKLIWQTTVRSVRQITPYDSDLVLRTRDDAFVVLSKDDGHRLSNGPAEKIVARAREASPEKKRLSTFNLYLTDPSGASYTVDPQEIYNKTKNAFPGFYNSLYKTSASGNEIWKVDVPGTSYIQAMDARNLYISTFFNAEVLCISKSNGRRQWDYFVNQGKKDGGPLQIMLYGKYLMVLGKNFDQPGTKTSPANPDQLDLLFLDRNHGTEKYFQRFPDVLLSSTTGKILYPGNGFFIINNGKGTIFFYECRGK